MRKEDKQAFEEVDNITPPVCPVCGENKLQNRGLLDECDFGCDGIFDMWQSVECDHCGARGQVCYTLSSTIEPLVMAGDDSDAALCCPDCGHIIDARHAAFDSPAYDIPFERLPVSWTCPECGRAGTFGLDALLFHADDAWMNVDDDEDGEIDFEAVCMGLESSDSDDCWESAVEERQANKDFLSHCDWAW